MKRFRHRAVPPPPPSATCSPGRRFSATITSLPATGPRSGSSVRTCRPSAATSCAGLQRDAQGAGARVRPAALRLRQCGQPCAGVAFACRHLVGAGDHLHARHHAAAKDRQDPHLWRIVGDDRADGGLFRSDAGRGAGFCQTMGAHFCRPSMIRRDRRPGQRRGRDHGAIAPRA